MNYYFDTEFIEDGKTIDLLSIGIVAENGREFYQCNRDANLQHADEWVIFNVFPHLNVAHAQGGWYWKEPENRDNAMRQNPKSVVVTHAEIRDRVRLFVGDDQKPKFWAYYADYDWVAFCQLFGRMVDLPKEFPMYCRDLKQYVSSIGNPKLPKMEGEHNALNDARWVRDMYHLHRTDRAKAEESL